MQERLETEAKYNLHSYSEACYKIQLKNWVVMIVLGQSEMYKAVYVEILNSRGQDKRL